MLGWVRLPVNREAGLIATDAPVGALADDPAQRWQTLEAGRFPTTRGEGVAEATAARANAVALGDRIRVGLGNRALDVTIVGLVDSPAESVVGGALPAVGRRRALRAAVLRGQRGVRRGRDPGRRSRRPAVGRCRHRARPRHLCDRPAHRPQPGGGRAAADPAALRGHRAVRLGAGDRQHLLDPVRPARPRARPAPLRRRHRTAAAALGPDRGAPPGRGGVGHRAGGRRRDRPRRGGAGRAAGPRGSPGGGDLVAGLAGRGVRGGRADLR